MKNVPENTDTKRSPLCVSTVDKTGEERSEEASPAELHENK